MSSALLVLSLLATDARAAELLQSDPIQLAVVRTDGAALTDVDADGDLDAVILDVNELVLVSLNAGGVLGPFKKVGTAADGIALLAADVDGDGDGDLLVPESRNDEVLLLENNGGVFAAPIVVATLASPAYEILAADVDGDLDLDVVVDGTSGLRLLLNDGTGAFAPYVDVDPLAKILQLAAGDVDGDGDPDIVATENRVAPYAVYFYENLGGTFAAGVVLVSLEGAVGLVLGDLDADADLDVFVGGEEGIVQLENLGGGALAGPVLVVPGLDGQALGAGDLDADGDLDLYGHGGAGGPFLLQNLSPGFAAPKFVGGESLTTAMIGGDVDGDGDADLLATSENPNAVELFASWTSTLWEAGDYGGADIVLADKDAVGGEYFGVGLFELPPGVEVAVVPGAPLVVDAVEVRVNGVLDGVGAGYAGGGGPFRDGGPGEGPAGGLPTEYPHSPGPGGGGHGGKGGAGGKGSGPGPDDGFAGGPISGSPVSYEDGAMGSGGGSGDELLADGTIPGGAGGAGITLRAAEIKVGPLGEIRADGALGDSSASDRGYSDVDDYGRGPGPAGGAGGSVVLDGAARVTVYGRISADGGDGGEAWEGFFNTDAAGGGGGGGGGRIKVFGPFVGSLQPVRGGNGGENVGRGGRGHAGGSGTVFVEGWAGGPPVLTLTAMPPRTIFDVAGATPMGALTVLVGTAAGADVVPSGPCAGTALGMVGPFGETGVSADMSGDWAAGKIGAALVPGAPVQVVDLATCTVSGVVLVP